jgi:hypothetical protein
MLGLLEQQALRYEKREIRVDMPGILKAPVHFRLNQFPYAVPIGLYDHAALDVGIIHHVRLQYDVGIPLRKVLVALRDVLYKFLVGSFRHTLLLHLSLRHGQQPWRFNYL